MSDKLLEYKMINSRHHGLESTMSKLNDLVSEGCTVHSMSAYGPDGYCVMLLVRENQLELKSPMGATL